MRTAERSVRDRLTPGHRQRLRTASAAMGTAVAREARLIEVSQAAGEEALQAAKADAVVAKKQQAAAYAHLTSPYTSLTSTTPLPTACTPSHNLEPPDTPLHSSHTLTHAYALRTGAAAQAA